MHLNILSSEASADGDGKSIFHASIASYFCLLSHSLFSWHFQTLLLLLKVFGFNLLLPSDSEGQKELIKNYYSSLPAFWIFGYGKKWSNLKLVPIFFPIATKNGNSCPRINRFFTNNLIVCSLQSLNEVLVVSSKDESKAVVVKQVRQQNPGQGHRDSLAFLKHLAAAVPPPFRSRRSMYSSRRRRRLRSRQGRRPVVRSRPVEEEGEAVEGKAGKRRTSSCLLKPSTCSLLEPMPGKPCCVKKEKKKKKTSVYLLW